MTYECRECVPADAEAVISFLESLQSERLPTITRMAKLPTVDEEREWIGRHADERGVVYMATEGSHVIGLLGAAVLGPAEFSCNCSFGVSVLAEHRGRGVATTLIGMLERWAERNGIERIELEVFGNNREAIRLYERLGFREDGRRVDAVRLRDSTRTDLVHMFKRTDVA